MSLSSALFKDKLPKELLEQDLAKALNLGILSLLSMKVILVFICVISLAPIFPLSAFCEISRGLPFASSRRKDGNDGDSKIARMQIVRQK